MIEEKIALSDIEILDWDTHRTQIEYQIQTLLNRGKSTRIIAMTIIGKYPYFRDEITEYIESCDDDNWLKKEVQKYKNKYNLGIASEKQKFYSALMRKGFEYGKIQEELRGEDNQ